MYYRLKCGIKYDILPYAKIETCDKKNMACMSKKLLKTPKQNLKTKKVKYLNIADCHVKNLKLLLIIKAEFSCFFNIKKDILLNIIRRFDIIFSTPLAHFELKFVFGTIYRIFLVILIR